LNKSKIRKPLNTGSTQQFFHPDTKAAMIKVYKAANEPTLFSEVRTCISKLGSSKYFLELFFNTFHEMSTFNEISTFDAIERISIFTNILHWKLISKNDFLSEFEQALNTGINDPSFMANIYLEFIFKFPGSWLTGFSLRNDMKTNEFLRDFINEVQHKGKIHHKKIYSRTSGISQEAKSMIQS